jgi:toxin CcdB
MARVLMRQCDVFSNPSERPSPNTPFVIVLQADRVFHTTTVVVAPLVKANRLREDQGLYPVFEIEGVRVALSITELATLPRRVLKNRIANLEQERHRIIRAIDALFTDA